MAGPSGAASTGAGQPVSAPRPFHERDPWGEKVHTYVRAQGFGAASDPAPGRWSRRQHWTAAELGTGTGCALACLLAAFERHAAPSQTLHYVGFERDPTMLDWWRDPASRARIPSPERAALEAILARPVRSTQGITRWRPLGGRATVTLVLGDAADWLPNLSFLADAWFLDAFEPAIENLLWSSEVIGHVARLTRPAGTASTFSAAGVVRTGLELAGFDVQRVPGFDTKRHMTLATRRDHKARRSIAPWFAPPEPACPGQVTVIGAGLAGAWCARAFADRGTHVTVVEPAGCPLRTSDVPLAAAAQPDGSWQSEQVRVHDAAWHLLAARCLDLGLAHRLLPIVTPQGATSRMALLATPREFITQLLDHPRIRRDDHGALDGFVVHATAFATGALDGSVCSKHPAVPNVGSIGQVPLASPMGTTVMDQGYALPCVDGSHAWIGATNHPGLRLDGDVTDPGHAAHPTREARLLEAMAARLLGAPQSHRSLWTGTRAASLDHLPLVGPVAGDAAFAGAYGAIRHGPAAQAWPPCPYTPGLWCSIAHGSHGMLTTPLAAELIADLAFGTPRCIADELLPFLLPQRFALRELRRARGR